MRAERAGGQHDVRPITKSSFRPSNFFFFFFGSSKKNFESLDVTAKVIDRSSVAGQRTLFVFFFFFIISPRIERERYG